MRRVLSEAGGENRIRNTCGASQNVFFMPSWRRAAGGLKRLPHLYDVFVGRLALHRGGDVRDGAVHLYGDHFDRNGHGASGQNRRVDNLGVLQGGENRGGE